MGLHFNAADDFSLRGTITPYLGVSKFVLSLIYLNGRQQLLTRLLVVNELPLWNGTSVQHVVSDIHRKTASLSVSV